MNELLTLPDGGRFVVRPMRAADAAAVRAGFAALSPESLRLRFFSPVPRVAESTLAELTAVDPAHQLVLLAFDADGGGTLAGGVRAVRHDGDATLADVAVTVAEAQRGRGLGGALLRRVRRAALAEGIRSLGGHVLVENGPARAMLRRTGATTHFDEPGVLRFEIPLLTEPATVVAR